MIKRTDFLLPAAIISVVIVICLVFFMYLEVKRNLVSEMVLNDVISYYHLHEEYPIQNEKSNLIQIDRLYEGNTPSEVQKSLDKGYLFYSIPNDVSVSENEIIRVAKFKGKIQNYNRKGSVITWEGPKNGNIYVWEVDGWVKIAEFRASQFHFAKAGKEYAIGDYNSSSSHEPLLLLQ